MTAHSVNGPACVYSAAPMTEEEAPLPEKDKARPAAHHRVDSVQLADNASPTPTPSDACIINETQYKNHDFEGIMRLLYSQATGHNNDCTKEAQYVMWVIAVVLVLFALILLSTLCGCCIKLVNGYRSRDYGPKE